MGEHELCPAIKALESLEYYVDKIQGALDLRTDKKDLPESDSDSDESIAVSYDPAKTHDLWDEGDDIDEETLRKFTEKYIDASCKGELSNYLESMIAALKDAQEDLPWHWYLKKLVGSVTSTWKKTTMRRNRRQPERLDLPGCLRSHTAKILIGLDISGSITDAEFRQAIGEVLHLVRCYNHEIIVAECDDEIRRTYRIRTIDDVRGRWTSAAAQPIPRSSPMPIHSASTSSSTSPTAKAKKNSRRRPKATKSSGSSRAKEINSP